MRYEDFSNFFSSDYEILVQDTTFGKAIICHILASLLMVSPTPMTLHSYPTGHYNYPSITQNEKRLLKNMFPRSLPPKLLTLHINAPYRSMNSVQPSHVTTHSVLYPHDPKNQPCGPPQPLLHDQNGK
jgi:hypothetical protein